MPDMMRCCGESKYAVVNFSGCFGSVNVGRNPRSSGKNRRLSQSVQCGEQRRATATNKTLIHTIKHSALPIHCALVWTPSFCTSFSFFLSPSLFRRPECRHALPAQSHCLSQTAGQRTHSTSRLSSSISIPVIMLARTASPPEGSTSLLHEHLQETTTRDLGTEDGARPRKDDGIL